MELPGHVGAGGQPGDGRPREVDVQRRKSVGGVGMVHCNR